MKTHHLLWLIPAAAVVVIACKRDLNNPIGKGLVSLRKSPVYAAGKVDFEAQI